MELFTSWKGLLNYNTAFYHVTLSIGYSFQNITYDFPINSFYSNYQPVDVHIIAKFVIIQASPVTCSPQGGVLAVELGTNACNSNTLLMVLYFKLGIAQRWTPFRVRK